MEGEVGGLGVVEEVVEGRYGGVVEECAQGQWL